MDDAGIHVTTSDGLGTDERSSATAERVETITKLAWILPETCPEPYPELDNIIIEILARPAS